jgi:hypothetical protein
VTFHNDSRFRHGGRHEWRPYRRVALEIPHSGTSSLLRARSPFKASVFVSIVCALFFMFGIASAQPAVPDQTHPRQVFIQRNIDGLGGSRLVLLDLLTGEERTVDVFGERFTVTPNGVLFYSPSENRVKLVGVDGEISDHPFMQPGETTRRIDWLFDTDALQIAWTLTDGRNGALTTLTEIAAFDGSNRRLLLADGPRDGIRAFPVAFSPDGTQLYMDYQPDSIGDLTTFRQYAGLFAVNLEDGEIETLPGEPGCFCGGGFGGGWFLRLALTPDLLNFDLRLTQLEREQSEMLPALPLTDFTQGGDVLVSPQGGRAVYALAQVRSFGTPDQEVQTVLVQVDLNNLTQTVLGDVVDFLLRPVAWTEDESAVILISPQFDGTWKISVPDGTLEQTARSTYLGTIRASA